MATVVVVGKRYGRLTVLDRAARTENGRVQYLCECDCGRKEIVQGVTLLNTRNNRCSICTEVVKHGGVNAQVIELILSNYKDKLPTFNPEPVNVGFTEEEVQEAVNKALEKAADNYKEQLTQFVSKKNDEFDIKLDEAINQLKKEKTKDKADSIPAELMPLREAFIRKVAEILDYKRQVKLLKKRIRELEAENYADD